MAVNLLFFVLIQTRHGKCKHDATRAVEYLVKITGWL